jgi:hypothetical protein
MIKASFVLVASFIFSFDVMAQQPNQQDLEKQRQQLRREIEQTQELLDNNKKTTKESLVSFR